MYNELVERCTLAEAALANGNTSMSAAVQDAWEKGQASASASASSAVQEAWERGQAEGAAAASAAAANDADVAYKRGLDEGAQFAQKSQQQDAFALSTKEYERGLAEGAAKCDEAAKVCAHVHAGAGVANETSDRVCVLIHPTPLFPFFTPPFSLFHLNRSLLNEVSQRDSRAFHPRKLKNSSRASQLRRLRATRCKRRSSVSRVKRAL